MADKKATATAEKEADNLIRTKDLADETNVAQTTIRKILRAKFYDDGTFTRYGWAPDDPVLDDIRAAIESAKNGATVKSSTPKAAKSRSKKSATPVAEAELEDLGLDDDLEGLVELDEDEDEDEVALGEVLEDVNLEEDDEDGLEEV